MNLDRPLCELYQDPTDPVNVLVNSSFELEDENGIVGWTVLEGSAETAERDDAGKALSLNGRVMSNRFETNARVPFEWHGEAKGRITGRIHFIEHERYLRTETFVHESADWQPFCWRFLPPPNGERAECELVGEGVQVDNLYLDGLGAAEYDFLDNQAGFHPKSLKRIVLRARNPIEGDMPRWELIDTLRGTTFAEGTLKAVGQGFWKRWAYVADFTSVEREGHYLLRVYLADRIMETPALRIWTGVYHHLAHVVAKYSYLQRCGTDIPGYHKACHTNDAVFRTREDQERFGTIEDPHGESDGYRDVTGGWHDAGDYNKWFHYFGYVEETLALMHKRVDLTQKTYGGDVPDVLSEVMWGADFFLKVQNSDGSFTGPICGYYIHENEETGEKRNSPWAIFWEKPYEDSGAGRVMDPRSRTFDYIGHRPGHQLALDLANSLANAARCVRGTDDARCRTYVNAALRSIPFVKQEEALANSPYWLSLYYDLYRATDRAEYRQKADEMVPVLLSQQKEDGSFGAPSALHGAFRPINTLMELLVDEPEHPAREEILAAAEKLISWLDKFTTTEPYNLVLVPSEEAKHGQITRDSLGRNAYIGSVAYTFALAARLTGRRDWLHRAEEQISWILGLNPHGVCQIVDGGRVHAGRYHGWSNMNDNDLHGALTGGIINGIMAPSETEGSEHDWSIEPPGFPILSVRRLDVPYSDHDLMNARHDSNEYWSLHHGGFQEAMSALAAAYHELDPPPRKKLCLLHSNSHGYVEATAYDELFDRSGWNADRMNSDAGFPHVNPNAYGVFVTGRTWVGSEHVDTEAFGIHVRRSWELGVPWVILEPDDERCLQWIEKMARGLLPDGIVKDLKQSDWEPSHCGKHMRMGKSTLHLVSDEATLERLLRLIQSGE